MPVSAFTFTKFAATGSALHAYTQSWIDRVTTAGGTVSTARQTVVNTFVNGLITDGLLDGTTIANSIIKYFLLFASDGFAGCNVPLIDAASVGNTALTGFVSGDYSTAGLTGNESTKYANTNFIPSAYFTSATGSSFGQYSSAGTVPPAYGVYGADQNVNSKMLYFFNNTDHGLILYDDIYYLFSNDAGYLHGLQIGNRPPNNRNNREIRNSTLLTSIERDGSPPTIPIYFFAVNHNSVAENWYPFTMRLLFIGLGLSLTQEAALNTRTQTLVSSL